MYTKRPAPYRGRGQRTHRGRSGKNPESLLDIAVEAVSFAQCLLPSADLSTLSFEEKAVCAYLFESKKFDVSYNKIRAEFGLEPTDSPTDFKEEFEKALQRICPPRKAVIATPSTPRPLLLLLNLNQVLIYRPDRFKELHLLHGKLHAPLDLLRTVDRRANSPAILRPGLIQLLDYLISLPRDSIQIGICSSSTWTNLHAVMETIFLKREFLVNPNNEDIPTGPGREGLQQILQLDRRVTKRDFQAENTWDTMWSVPAILKLLHFRSVSEPDFQEFDMSNTIVLDDTERKIREISDNAILFPSFDANEYENEMRNECGPLFKLKTMISDLLEKWKENEGKDVKEVLAEIKRKCPF